MQTSIESIPRRRRRFGRFFYATVSLAVLVAASTSFWTTIEANWRGWTLVGRLHNPDPAVRRAAADGLIELGSAASPWVIGALRGPDVEARRLACSILRRTGPARPGAAVSAFLDALGDSDPTVREIAAGQLGRPMGDLSLHVDETAQAPSVRALRRATVDTSAPVRRAAVQALATIGPGAKAAVPDLELALNDPAPMVRIDAAQALNRIDPEGSRARVVAAMKAMAVDESLPVNTFERDDAIRLLCSLPDYRGASGADEAAAALIPLLKQKDMASRHGAIYLLILYCPRADATRKALVEALDGDDGGLRCEAALYFLEHDPEMASRAIDTMAGQLLHPLDGSMLADDAVKQMRKRSRYPLAHLTDRLIAGLASEGGTTARVAAATALREIGPEAGRAVPRLVEAAGAADRDLAMTAIAALARIDPAAAVPFIPMLVDRIGVGEPVPVRIAAIASLRDLGPAAGPALPALLRLSDEDDIWIASAAIQAISSIDPDTGARLKRAARDREADVPAAR